jgi:diacylglycerol kinase family enzyme
VEKIKYFDFYRVKELVLDISKPVCTEADGEFLGHYPLQVSIIPKQLNIISNYKIPD